MRLQAPAAVAVVAAAAAATAAAAPSRALLAALPNAYLGEMIGLLGESDYARLLAAAGVAQGRRVDMTQTERGARCQKATECGQACAAIVRNPARYQQLDARCRAACWHSLSLRMARGAALADVLARRELQLPCSRADLDALPVLRNMVARADTGGFVEAKTAAEATLKAAFVRGWLLLSFPRALTLAHVAETVTEGRQALHPFTDPAVQSAVRTILLRTLRSRARVESDNIGTDIGGVTSAEDMIDFVWKADEAKRGFLSFDYDEGSFYKCGFTTEVRSALLRTFATHLRSATEVDTATLRSLLARLREDELDERFSLYLVRHPPELVGRADDAPVDLVLAMPLTHGFEVGEGLEVRNAMHAASLARVLPVLYERHVLSHAQILEWLRIGESPLPADAPIAQYEEVASVDAPPALPVYGCAGFEKVARLVDKSELYFSLLPQDSVMDEDEVAHFRDAAAAAKKLQQIVADIVALRPVHPV